jgi:hypothetical protein
MASQRELKFRALAENLETGEKKWYYYGIMTKPVLLGYKWVVKDLQFIGRIDKNKKEIYEGDIVEINGYGINGIFEIVWDECTAKFATSIYEEDCFEHSESVMNIIGNIYDHPELLNS